MAAENDFQDLIRRIQARDPGAEEELVRVYGPHIRRIARIRLDDPRLRRLLDSADICQLVLASFFARVPLGQYRLDTPEQLVRLLEAMTRHKVVDQRRR